MGPELRRRAGLYRTARTEGILQFRRHDGCRRIHRLLRLLDSEAQRHRQGARRSQLRRHRGLRFRRRRQGRQIQAHRVLQRLQDLRALQQPQGIPFQGRQNRLGRSRPPRKRPEDVGSREARRHVGLSNPNTFHTQRREQPFLQAHRQVQEGRTRLQRPHRAHPARRRRRRRRPYLRAKAHQEGTRGMAGTGAQRVPYRSHLARGILLQPAGRIQGHDQLRAHPQLRTPGSARARQGDRPALPGLRRGTPPPPLCHLRSRRCRRHARLPRRRSLPEQKVELPGTKTLQVPDAPEPCPCLHRPHRRGRPVHRTRPGKVWLRQGRRRAVHEHRQGRPCHQPLAGFRRPEDCHREVPQVPRNRRPHRGRTGRKHPRRPKDRHHRRKRALRRREHRAGPRRLLLGRSFGVPRQKRKRHGPDIRANDQSVQGEKRGFQHLLKNRTERPFLARFCFGLVNGHPSLENQNSTNLNGHSTRLEIHRGLHEQKDQK